MLYNAMIDEKRKYSRLIYDKKILQTDIYCNYILLSFIIKLFQLCTTIKYQRYLTYIFSL